MREGDDSQRAVWAAHGLDRGSPFGHCDTAGSFPQPALGLQAPFDSCRDQTERQKWMAFFSSFPMYFLKKLKIVLISQE